MRHSFCVLTDPYVRRWVVQEDAAERVNGWTDVTTAVKTTCSGCREARLLQETAEAAGTSVSGWQGGYRGWQVPKHSAICSQTE